MIVSCAQIRLDIDDQAGSWARVIAAVEDVGPDADILVLPELVNSGYVFADQSEARRLAEALGGPRLRELAETGAAAGCVVVSGWCEATADGPRSSAVVIDGGRVVGSYRKCHLWDQEQIHFVAGDAGPWIVDTTAGRLAVMVCYDLEFPEFVRRAAQAGAQLIAAPVNWPLLPRPAVERPLELIKAQAYAGAYRVPIAIADRAGSERGVDWIGGSSVIGPDGYLRTPPPPPGPAHELSVHANIDLAINRRIGPSNDALFDRRPDLYAELSAKPG